MAATRVELREATRERVLAAADRLFRERGFEAATIRDIADASGMSVGSVMAVGDKNALLVRIFDGLIEAGHERTTPDSGDDASCAQSMVNLVRPFVSLFASRQDLSRVYASIQVLGKEPSPLFSRLAVLLVDDISAAISRHGCTSPRAVAPIAQAIYFAYIGTLFSWSARPTIDENELTDSLHATFAAICTCKEQPR